MHFNKEQLLAINTLDKNIGVIAGAGTGKTAILTERFIKIIQNSKRAKSEALESILAITFTEKATKEMISRIREKLYVLEVEDEHYRNITDSLSLLNISTIHAFCASVIRENSFILGIDSQFEILDQHQSDNILMDVIKEVLSEDIEKNNTVKSIMISKSIFNVNRLAENIKDSFIKIRNKGYDIDSLISKLPRISCDQGDLEDFYKKSLEFKDQLLDEKIINGRLGYVKNFKNGLYQELVESRDDTRKSEILNKYINDLSKIPERLDPTGPYFKIYEDLNKAAVNIILSIDKEYYYIYEDLARILKDIEKRFTQSKLKDNYLDYDDLLYFTRELFNDDNIASQYRDKFDYIMIDEFQDTNSLQRDIFFILASDKNKLDRNNLFVVGDPKQSIYGFRGSDIDVFYESLDEIKKSGGEIISLKENYRSSEELIDYANNIFSNIMGNRYDELNANTNYLAKKVGLLNLLDDNNSEGQLISNKILELVNNGRKFDEIAILYRTSSKVKELEKALKKNNIPYVNPNSRDFYNRREIKDLILFLKSINLPEDSHSLFGLLKSRAFLIDDLSLFELNQYEGETLYEKLQSKELKNRDLLDARSIINSLVNKKDELDLVDLVNEVIDESKYLELMAAFSSSGQEVENIRKFQKIVLDYSCKNQGILNEFLDFIEEEKNKDTEEARLNFENKGVSLSTIHGSKGLEYPVVFIYNPDSIIKNSGSLIEVNGKKGLGININETKTTYELVKAENYLEELKELERVFYVAVTRAKEELYFSNNSVEGQLEENEKSILGLLARAENYEYVPTTYTNVEKKETLQKIELVAIEGDENIETSIFRKELPRSSFSAYSTFLKCPRQYYYKYKLGLNDYDLSQESLSDRKVEEDLSLLEEIKDSINPIEFGLLIHKMIEIFNENQAEFNDIFKLSTKILGLEENNLLEEKSKKHFFNYLQEDIAGKKYSEYDFLLKFEEGFIFGSIDEIILSDEGIFIKDFKTNRVNNLDYLVSIYRPQIELYTMAVEEIFKTEVKKSMIHFLETNQVVTVEKDKIYRENLEKDINKFLSFIYFNDSIESYKCSDKCDQHCKYINICTG